MTFLRDLQDTLSRGARLAARGVARLRPRSHSLGYEYQDQLMRKIPREGVILDVGSGHEPLPQATILADRFLGGTKHRALPFQRDQRPVLQLDVHALPFANDSVDYLYCSHVLEHVDDPERACAELMRVGRAGYIETPTRMKDVLFGWARDTQHRWHVVAFENRLLFFEYSARELDGLGSNYWRDTILGDRYHPNQDLFFPNHDLFNTTLEWSGTFEVTVFRRQGKK